VEGVSGRSCGENGYHLNNDAKIRFDSSLKLFADEIGRELGPAAVSAGVFVRDGSGILSFVADAPSPTPEHRQAIEQRLKDAIRHYVRPDRSIAFCDDIGAKKLLADRAAVQFQVGDRSVKLLDRRIVGSAWLDVPKDLSLTTPRIVFSSLKGGVGRSTALAIAASDLARRNQNVLVVDLDLEAPGLGELLLGQDRKPLYGSIDFLVENGVSKLSKNDLDQFIGASELTTPEGGRVDVLPALGTSSILNPENVLAKLSRAMIEDIDGEGKSVSVASQMASMLECVESHRTYDVVMIDSRAGLAEITASAIIGLGANVLLFGSSQTQTYEGFRALFAALRMLVQRDLLLGRSARWRQSIKAVHAKASLEPQAVARHRDELYELFAEYLYDAEIEGGSSSEFAFSIDDPNAPHWPLIIPFNPIFADFDSARNANQLTQTFYEQTFRQFLNGVDTLIANSSDQA
jgi:hypothetical protein